MVNPAELGTMPFDDLVAVIENMDYRTIISLSQTSTVFNELLEDRFIKDIVNKKLRENLAGRLSYDLDEDLAELYIYLRDILSDQTFNVSWTLYFSLEELRDIISKLKSGPGDSTIRFGNGELYYDKNYLSYDGDNNSFSMDLNKTLFVRLLEEYEELLRDMTGGNVYIRTDRSVDKVLFRI